MKWINNPSDFCNFAKKEAKFDMTEAEGEWLLGILEGHDFGLVYHENTLYRVDIDSGEVTERMDKYAETIFSLFGWASEMYDEIVAETVERINECYINGADVAEEELRLSYYKLNEPIISALDEKLVKWAEDNEVFIY